MRWREWAADLCEKCQEAEKQHPGLRLDLIQLYPLRQMSHRDLRGLVQQHVGEPPAVEFEFVEDDLIARYYGVMSGYSEFPKIGEQMYAWLRATDPELPAKRSYWGWPKLLHDITTYCPPVGFEVESNPRVLHTDVASDPPVTTLLQDADIFFAVARYLCSPFELSCTVLRMFIQPYQTQFLRTHSSKVHLVPWQLRCVFANPQIARLEPKTIIARGLKDAVTVISLNDPFARPRFFRGPNSSGRLFLGGHMVRPIRAGSKAMCIVLQAFQDSDWPEYIETNELLGLDSAHAARDVVDKLSNLQEGPLRIRFTTVDSGDRIVWDVVTNS